MQQLDLLPPAPEPDVDLDSYDFVVVAFSGGKDSMACILHLLEKGVNREKMELWHHLVDGREGSALMDWPCTEGYVRACAEALGIPVYFSWRVGGFEREMLREEQRTAPVKFETPAGDVMQIGGKGGKLGTRRKFPQVSADLTVRWCSAYLKIMCADAALINQDRFRYSRTLFVTGERAEESPGRARYAQFEPHRADLRDGVRYWRHIDHWRPVHRWPEADVWAAFERWRINPHPAYRLGWGRLSCMTCIFGSDHQWASAAAIAPEMVQVIADYEVEFDHTIHRTLSVPERVARGRPYEIQESDVAAALAAEWNEPIILPDDEPWQLPAGAFGESCGPI